MTTQVTDAYEEYVARRREKAPPPDPTATLELTELELHILVMTIAERGSIVYPKHLCTEAEALDTWATFKNKLVATRLHFPEEGEEEGDGT